MEKEINNTNSDKECPVLDANIFSRIVFWWTRKLVQLGLKREYEPEDLYKVYPKLSTKYLGDALLKAWNTELTKNKPNLQRAVLSVFLKSMLKQSAVTIFQDGFCRCATGPALVLILDYFSGTTPFTNGLVGGILLLMFSYTYTLTRHINLNSWDVIGMEMRIALTYIVFKKGLRLSQRALGNSSIGQITNIISNDVNRFDRGFRGIPYIIYGPVQVILGIGILVFYMGPTALFGTLIFLLMVPLQSFFAQLNGKYRAKSAIKTDYRVRLMNEIVNGILLIKMSAWEGPFSEYVHKARVEEMKIIKIKSMLGATNFAIQMFSQRLVIFVILVGFVKLSGFALTPSIAFLIATLTNIMKTTVTIGMPRGVTLFSEIITALKRIQNFLILEERADKVENDPFHKSTLPFVKLENVTAKWSPNDTTKSLSNVSLSFGSSELLAVVGPVGSGKTTLIQAVLRELPLESGKVKINGKIAYVPQNPWLFNATVRENVLFGQQYKKDWFKCVVEASGLSIDFQQLPHGENTLIGDRGINLSGGQKARINIARAVYSNADIYLLDDPFSALDARVGREVFQNVVKNLLGEKCVLLVTHLHHYLESANQILVLGNGEILARGLYHELKDTNYLKIQGSSLDKEFIIDDENEIGTEGVTVRRISQSHDADKSVSLKINSSSCSESDRDYGTFPVVPPEKESRSTGRITWGLYWKYFRSGNTRIFVLTQFVFLIVLTITYAACDYWIKIWSSSKQNVTGESEIVNNYNENFYVLAFGVFLVLSLLVSTVYFTLFVTNTTRSSISLHNQLFKSVLRAPMRFFEVNSYGRVFNRFVNDIGIVDDNLPQIYIQATSTLLNIIVALFFVTIASTPLMILPAFGVLILIILIRQLFLGPCSSLKRLESICRSPIFGLLNTSLSGLSIIRAFGVQDKFIDTFNKAQDTHTSSLYLYYAISRANAAFVDWIVNVYLTLTLITFLFIETDSSSVGLALSAALLLVGGAGTAIMNSIDLDNQIVSVERILEYSNTIPEASIGIYGRKPGNDWPNQGKIEFNNVYVKYGNDAPILSDINMLIRAKEKIGIVGRTGAGKSSLIATIFRIVEPCAGSIHIDGCDISKIGLHDLRKKLSIIPQSPILFIGTVRKNLDPFGIYMDNQLWNVLEDVHLAERVRTGSVQGLDSDIAEGGKNLSEGEKQLLCLARAILSKNKILILDEATANIDSKTDALIQKTIREKFRDCTILTIAHRLDTVMDSDKIIVLEAGRILEFDEPFRLLQNHNGYLYNLCSKTGSEGFELLVHLAREAYQRKLL